MMPQKGHSISCQLELHSCEADWILVPAEQLQLEPTYIMQQCSSGKRRCGAEPTRKLDFEGSK